MDIILLQNIGNTKLYIIIGLGEEILDFFHINRFSDIALKVFIKLWQFRLFIFMRGFKDGRVCEDDLVGMLFSGHFVGEGLLDRVENQLFHVIQSLDGLATRFLI